MVEVKSLIEAALLFLLNVYFLVSLHILVLKSDTKRLFMKITSGRRFMVYFSAFMVYFSFWALSFHLIDNESFKYIIYFSLGVSGIGGIGIGGEKIFMNAKGGKNV